LHKALASTLLFAIVIRYCVATDAPTACLAAKHVCTDETRRNDRTCVALRNALIALPFQAGLELGCRQTHPGGGPVYSAFTGESRSIYDLAYTHTWTSWFCGALVGGHILDCVEAPIYRQGQHPRCNAAKTKTQR
jgi:cytochrome b561